MPSGVTHILFFCSLRYHFNSCIGVSGRSCEENVTIDLRGMLCVNVNCISLPVLYLQFVLLEGWAT
jgi:hypothetical protein